MYGYGGEWTPEDWAKQYGLEALRPVDQLKLIASGKYTAGGAEIRQEITITLPQFPPHPHQASDSS